MDIWAELNKLPYYLYVFDERAMILGGHSSLPHMVQYGRIHNLWEDIKALYKSHELSDEEKSLYARNVQKMARGCGQRDLTRIKIKEKVDSLNEKEKEDIKWQIEMYKLGREFYRDYVHNR
ncbi:hypothetical protein [Lacrimispora sp.]|uniref:hypothetical protein n=1 Tax=Lacrimispora sp. TaxID=2719234 RepID=UPI0028AC62C1|nr:hypothetical protein [Lacrimispora sp.]